MRNTVCLHWKWTLMAGLTLLTVFGSGFRDEREWEEEEATEWSQNVSWETNRWRLEESLFEVTSFDTNTKSKQHAYAPSISPDCFNLHAGITKRRTASEPVSGVYTVSRGSVRGAAQPEHCAVSNTRRHCLHVLICRAIDEDMPISLFPVSIHESHSLIPGQP